MIWWRRRPAEPAATPAELLDEQLSAFIDGDLSEAAARAIEARLTAEPELRDALSGMQHVRDALVALGESAAPRAFTLEAPPARAGLPRMELFARLGAAVSALALAAVLVGDVVTTAQPDVQSAASLAQPVTMQAAAAPADTEERATSEGQATTEQATAEAQAEAASAATPEVATLAAPAPAPALAPAAAPATTDAADDTEAAPAGAPAAAPSPAQAADGGQASEPGPSDTTAPTAEQAATESPQPSLADPGGDALDAAQLALLALLLIFGVVAVWQFARRPR